MDFGLDLCDLTDLENQSHNLKINRLSNGPIGKLYAKFQVDSRESFQDIEWKWNLTFLTSVTLKIGDMIPKSIGFSRGLYGSCASSFKLIAQRLSEISCGNG